MRTSTTGEAGAGRRHAGRSGNSWSSRAGVDGLAGYGLRRRSRSGGTNHRSAHRGPTGSARTCLWLGGRGCAASYRRTDRRTRHGGGPGFSPRGSTRASRNGSTHRCRFRNRLNWMSGTARWFRLRRTGKGGRDTSNGSGRLSRSWRCLGCRRRGHGGRLGRLLGKGGRNGRRRGCLGLSGRRRGFQRGPERHYGRP